ncbi:hypothetical protein TWF506_002491 [Arthrobotrys conoides]|uniref:Uncharacterized protein n=1 Tax=Arthrobotrys conoides TaxID=74498 RepID=A0AAN8MZW1_9PEZI
MMIIIRTRRRIKSALREKEESEMSKRTESERKPQKTGCRQNSPGASEERATEISQAQTPPLGILILLRPKTPVADMLSKPVTPGIINQNYR